MEKMLRSYRERLTNNTRYSPSKYTISKCDVPVIAMLISGALDKTKHLLPLRYTTLGCDLSETAVVRPEGLPQWRGTAYH
jgi:hypothetical protein